MKSYKTLSLLNQLLGWPRLKTESSIKYGQVFTLFKEHKV